MEPNTPRRRRGGNGPRPDQKPTKLQKRRMDIIQNSENPSNAYALENGIWTLETQDNLVSDPLIYKQGADE